VEVTPQIEHGRIILAGKSVVRRRANKDEGKPAESIRFDVRETMFLAEAGKKKTLTIDAGDAGERVILEVRLVNDEGVEVR
jgi:hypothetical protein